MLTGKKELPSVVLLGLASGAGTAAIYACVEIVPVLIEGMGPATVFSRACPHTSLFTLAAVTGLVFTLLHMLWSVFGFLLYAHRAYVVAPVLVLSHFGASYFVCHHLPSHPIPSHLCSRSLLHVLTHTSSRLDRRS